MKTIALFIAFALCASPASAGIFSRLFGCRTCKPAAVSKPSAKAPQYRYECKNGVCRRVEVK